MKRTCNELGLCQALTPACPPPCHDCPNRDHPLRLAPGVIDGPFQSVRHQTLAGRWLEAGSTYVAYLAAFAMAAMMLGLLLGYVSHYLTRWLS